jgi:hypothetical protein
MYELKDGKLKPIKCRYNTDAGSRVTVYQNKTVSARCCYRQHTITKQALPHLTSNPLSLAFYTCTHHKMPTRAGFFSP